MPTKNVDTDVPDSARPQYSTMACHNNSDTFFNSPPAILIKLTQYKAGLWSGSNGVTMGGHVCYNFNPLMPSASIILLFNTYVQLPEVIFSFLFPCEIGQDYTREYI